MGYIATEPGEVQIVSREFIFHKPKHGYILLLDRKLPFFYTVIAAFHALISWCFTRE